MALHLPNSNEQMEIVEAFCHAVLSDSKRYKAFLRFYNSTCLARGKFFVPIDPPIFKTHADIIKTVRDLRNNPTLTRDAFLSFAFQSDNILEREYSLRTAVKVGFLFDCASKDDYSDVYQRAGAFPVKWTATQTFLDFLQGAFPAYSPKPFHSGLRKYSLKAWKLRKRYGIRLVPTSDLVQHLIYDRQTSTIKVFHQVAFLKAHLRHTAELPLEATFEESLQM